MKSLVNSLTLLIANSITSVAYYVVIILIARRLGAFDFGDYLFAITYAGLFVTLPNFGLDRIFIREVSRNEDALGQYLTATIVLRLMLTVLAAILALGIARLLGYTPHIHTLVLILGFSLVANMFSELFRSTFYAFEMMPVETLLRALGRLLTVAGVGIAIFRGYGLATVSWVIAFAALLEVGLYALSVFLKFKPRNLQINWRLCRELAQECFPMAVNTLLVVIYFRLGLIILSTLKGSEVAGWFGAAFTFVQLLQLVSGAVAGVALPKMARQYLVSPNQLLESLSKATRYLLLLVFPLCVGISLSARYVIEIVYGSQYFPSVGALQILIWASVFMFLGSIFSTALISLNKQYWLGWTAVAAVAINVTLNLLLIPRLSYVGCSIATVMTEAFVALLSYLAVCRYLKGGPNLYFALKPLMAALAMAACMYLLQDLYWILQVILAGAIYIMAVIILRAIPAEDWQVLWSMLRFGRSAHDAF